MFRHKHVPLINIKNSVVLTVLVHIFMFSNHPLAHTVIAILKCHSSTHFTNFRTTWSSVFEIYHQLSSHVKHDPVLLQLKQSSRWCISNAQDLYSEDVQTESRPKHRQSSQVFELVLSSFRVMPRYYLDYAMTVLYLILSNSPLTNHPTTNTISGPEELSRYSDSLWDGFEPRRGQ